MNNLMMNIHFVSLRWIVQFHNQKQKKTTGKLTAVATYKTRYVDRNSNKLILSFRVGALIRVNAIIRLPTFHEWKILLDIDNKQASSKVLNCYFDLCFQYAATGFPQGITFDPSTFVRLHRPTITGLSLLAHDVASEEVVKEDEMQNQQITIHMSKCANSADNRASTLMIEVPARIWRPKVISRYTVPDYECEDIDDILHYKQYGWCVYRNKLEWSDTSSRTDVNKFNEIKNSVELEENLIFDKYLD